MGIPLNIHLILSDVLIPCFKSVQRKMEGHNFLVWYGIQISFPMPLHFEFLYGSTPHT